MAAHPLAPGGARPGKARKKLTIAVALAAALAAGFVLYRVFAVYTVRTSGCPAAGDGAERQAVRVAAGRQPAPEAGRALRVVSYNIEGHAALWNREHLDEVAETLRRLDPDVVGLQEVHRGTWQARFADQAAELARRTGYEVWFGPSFTAGGGEFGNALLTRGEVVAARVLPLPSVGEPRSALEATIRIGGRELTFFVTHLAAWGPLRREIRLEQTECLAELAGASRRPAVLVGDLNAGPGTPELTRLAGGAPLALCGSDSAPTHRRTGARLDHVLCTPGWGAASARVAQLGPSDHWPVTAVLTWEGGPAPERSPSR